MIEKIGQISTAISFLVSQPAIEIVYIYVYFEISETDPQSVSTKIEVEVFWGKYMQSNKGTLQKISCENHLKIRYRKMKSLKINEVRTI